MEKKQQRVWASSHTRGAGSASFLRKGRKAERISLVGFCRRHYPPGIHT